MEKIMSQAKKYGKTPDVFVATLMWQNRKALIVNAAIVLFLTLYTLFGGVVFLHFEKGFQDFLRQNETRTKTRCIEQVLTRNRNEIRVLRDSDFAHEIVYKCLKGWHSDPKHEWNFKTAALYGFGILTTLGYGKIEPKTTNGRIFAVIYGFLGIPITVILLTNIGRYLESLAMKLKNMCSKVKEDISCNDSISTATLFFIVLAYLTFGAVFIPLLNGQFDFFNGIYFAFICLTAIEYGDLVPHNNYYVPVVLVYVCIGLAISTIALDIGSMYVRKLHYIGQKLKNIANIKIWFGAKDLRISEFVNAVGANIGIEQSVLSDIDLESLVKIAIQVKEGRLMKVPQKYMIVEGIWPPELVPLFLKDGQFPSFVDQDDIMEHKKKRSVVRFEDEIESLDSPTEETSQQISRLSPPPTDSSADRALRLHPSSGPTSQQTTNSTSLRSARVHCSLPPYSPDAPPTDRPIDTPDQLIESYDIMTPELLIHESASFEALNTQSEPIFPSSHSNLQLSSSSFTPLKGLPPKPARKFFKGSPFRISPKKSPKKKRPSMESFVSLDSTGTPRTQTSRGSTWESSHHSREPSVRSNRSNPSIRSNRSNRSNRAGRRTPPGTSQEDSGTQQTPLLTVRNINDIEDIEDADASP